MPVPKAGDQLPDVVLLGGTPLSQIEPGVSAVRAVKLRDVFEGKTGVLVNVPGAFTPGCSRTHLPSYLANLDKLKEAGAEVICFTAVNDPFVLTEWGVAYGAFGKITFLADTHGKLAEAFDVVVDCTASLGGKRGKRYSAVIQNNEVKYFNLDDSLSCSLADPTMKQLLELKAATKAASDKDGAAAAEAVEAAAAAIGAVTLGGDA